mgnify:CR=1 FL=1
MTESRPVFAWSEQGGGGKRGGKEEGLFESREAQQPLCGTRPHSQATADGPEGGAGILTSDKTPQGLNPDKSTREPRATLRHGERG